MTGGGRRTPASDARITRNGEGRKKNSEIMASDGERRGAAPFIEDGSRRIKAKLTRIKS